MADNGSVVNDELQIAEVLQETRAGPIKEIKLVVRALGAEATWQLVRQAQDIHAGDGMLVGNRSRKRTLGGVFFELAKQTLSEEDRDRIFSEAARRRHEAYLKRQARRAQQRKEPPAAAPASWSVELVHVPSGKSSDAAAPRIINVARGWLGTYDTEAEAVEAGHAAVRAALKQLYRSRLETLQPPQIKVRARPEPQR